MVQCDYFILTITGFFQCQAPPYTHSVQTKKRQPILRLMAMQLRVTGVKKYRIIGQVNRNMYSKLWTLLNARGYPSLSKMATDKLSNGSVRSCGNVSNRNFLGRGRRLGRIPIDRLSQDDWDRANFVATLQTNWNSVRGSEPDELYHLARKRQRSWDWLWWGIVRRGLVGLGFRV